MKRRSTRRAATDGTRGDCGRLSGCTGDTPGGAAADTSTAPAAQVVAGVERVGGDWRTVGADVVAVLPERRRGAGIAVDTRTAYRVDAVHSLRPRNGRPAYALTPRTGSSGQMTTSWRDA